MNWRPIILPELPPLSLPDSPNLAISLPSLPILPSIELPDLPDLPALPTIELPDLPPPPKLPKILSSIEIILDFVKLVLKARCLLLTLPIAPEDKV
jgi:hypothetical protein